MLSGAARRARPRSRIYFLSIKPSIGCAGRAGRRWHRANRAGPPPIAQEDPRLVFVIDLTPALLASRRRSLDDDVFLFDGLHLNADRLRTPGRPSLRPVLMADRVRPPRRDRRGPLSYPARERRTPCAERSSAKSTTCSASSSAASSAEEVEPHVLEWNEAGIVPRAIWKRMGEEGYLGANMPEEYGGAGADFLYDAIIMEELAYARAHCLQASLHTDICLPYLASYGSEDQKQRYLAPAIAGDCLVSIGMTEPGTGSDLANVQDHGDPRRRRVRAERRQDLHLERPERAPLHRGREDRSRETPRRHQPAARRDRHARLPEGPQPREDRAARVRTRASSSSRTAACRPRTCSARKGRASRC